MLPWSGCVLESQPFFLIIDENKEWQYTRWFKYDRDDLCVNKSQFVPVIFEPPFTYNATLRRVRETTVAVEKENKYYIFSACVCVVLVIQHATRMRRIILSSVLSSPYFSTLAHKQHAFHGKREY